jgi:hypothetical protein
VTLASGRAGARAFLDALPKPFPLLRGHQFEALSYSAAPRRPIGTAPSKAGKENPAKRKKSDRLPKGNPRPSEKGWQQPIPQQSHDFAAKGDERRHPQDRQGSNEDQSLGSRFHILLLRLS